MATKKKTPREIQHECEIIMRIILGSLDIPQPKKEHQFLSTRKFRFDYAWIEQKIALEVEGGVWIQGRHTRGAGFVKDMEKYNLACVAGWKVLRFTPQQLRKKETYNLLSCLFEVYRELGDKEKKFMEITTKMLES
jgi:very-short-patch-repair endonuclease